MEITSTPTSPRPNAAASSAGAAISSDFNTFLRMLTVQITNQDPLSPMNAEDFAVQLATFSGVEQAVRTNELLVALSAQMNETGFGQMAAWVGMEARAAMPVRFDGNSINVSPPDPIAGNRHQLVAFDSTGAEVWRQTIDPSDGNFLWAGVDPASGQTLAPGLHEFWLESFDGDRLVASEVAQPYGRVREVRHGPQGIVLLMDGGIEVSADSVTALRNPDPPAPIAGY